ncbi:MAG: hypothetical protein ACOC8J_19710 [Ralstonia sp.]
MKASANLPVTCDLSPVYTISLVTALLMSGASVAGLVAPAVLYHTEAVRRSFLANDMVNLLVGLPLLLAAWALTRRGELLGLLFWPGALFYATYTYIAYAAALPLTWQFVLYLVLVGLSAWAILRLLHTIDGVAVQERLAGAVPARLAGGVLVGLGGLFFFRAGAAIVGALVGGTPVPPAELAVLVADLLITPLWVIGGVALWRREVLGYVAGAGLLFQASMLFVALLVFFILQPFIAGVPFPTEDFMVILAVGSVCFVPFGLFARGIVKR